jgi:hypothetical protein
MSTLTEIESAVERLSRDDQEKLLRHLESRLHRSQAVRTASASQEWADRLDALGASISTGVNGPSTEQILDELREERG